MAPGRPKDGPKMTPRWAQDGPRWPQVIGPKIERDSYDSFKIGRGSEKCIKHYCFFVCVWLRSWADFGKSPKCAVFVPRLLGPNAPGAIPRGPSKGPQDLAPRLAGRSPWIGPKMAQDGPKMVKDRTRSSHDRERWVKMAEDGIKIPA